jgi:hypothetical protein
VASTLTARIVAQMKDAGLLNAAPLFPVGTVVQVVHDPRAPLAERYVGEVDGRVVIRSSLEAAIRRWIATMPGVSASPDVALRSPCAPKE